jgi:glutathione synthase/RimK-type ligase-like ATP-grasp enzyme
VLNGHSGRGIVVAATPDGLVQAPLYVEYVPKQDEYRIHVFNNEVIATQRKARRHDVENPNWKIRNHANGFVFARDGVVAPPLVLEQSIMAVAALGLDFGGVDVVFNRNRNMAYVLEVNSACGLEGQTVNDYANALQRIAR